MSRFFAGLVERALGHAPAIRPRLPARFETSDPPLPPEQDASSETATAQSEREAVPPATRVRGAEDAITSRIVEPDAQERATPTPAARPVAAAPLTPSASEPVMHEPRAPAPRAVVIPAVRVAPQPRAPHAGVGAVAMPVAATAPSTGSAEPVPAAPAPAAPAAAPVHPGTSAPPVIVPAMTRAAQPERTTSQRTQPAVEDAAPEVHITIGRVEIRAVSEAGALPTRAPPRSIRAPLALDEYQRQRNRGER